MDEPYFTRPGEGERVGPRGHRILGELPHLARVPGGRIFTVGVLLAGLGIAAYFVSALTTYFIEGEFTKARTRRRMTKAIDHIRDHIIVCGVGTTGVHVVEELVWTKWPLVAIDRDLAKLEKLQELSVDMLPTVLGNATEDEVLEQAGIRRARGIVAALTDDKDNLFICVSARQLNPKLRIIAKGVDMAASEKLTSCRSSTSRWQKRSATRVRTCGLRWRRSKPWSTRSGSSIDAASHPQTSHATTRRSRLVRPSWT